MGRVEPRLGRQHPIVELAPPARDARLDPAPLELVGIERRLELRVEHLGGARKLGRDPLAPEDEGGGVLLRFDLAAEPHAHAHE